MGKISEATLRTILKGTENIPITDTDLPKGRTTAANLKTFVTPDLSGYATNEDLDAKADVAGDEFTGPIGSPQVTITRPSQGAMAAILANSRDINFRTMNAGVDSMTFNVQYATPLKITEAGIFENNVLLEDKYAKIEDIPVVTGFITKTDADGYYQPKGEYATQDDVDAKQDTLVSGTNIKSINGETILGSGDIEIEGESTAIVDHETNDTTFELTPNTLHRWGEVTSLTLTLGAEIPNIVNEYMIQFTSGATATQLSLPETVKWINTPEIVANAVYQISILNNLAVMGGWSNE